MTERAVSAYTTKLLSHQTILGDYVQVVAQLRLIPLVARLRLLLLAAQLRLVPLAVQLRLVQFALLDRPTPMVGYMLLVAELADLLSHTIHGPRQA